MMKHPCRTCSQDGHLQRHQNPVGTLKPVTCSVDSPTVRPLLGASQAFSLKTLKFNMTAVSEDTIQGAVDDCSVGPLLDDSAPIFSHWDD